MPDVTFLHVEDEHEFFRLAYDPKVPLPSEGDEVVLGEPGSENAEAYLVASRLFAYTAVGELIEVRVYLDEEVAQEEGEDEDQEHDER